MFDLISKVEIGVLSFIIFEAYLFEEFLLLKYDVIYLFKFKDELFKFNIINEGNKDNLFLENNLKFSHMEL